MPQNQRQQAMYVSTGNPETVDDSRLVNPGQLGRHVTVKQPGVPGSPGVESYRDKTYRYIRTDSTMTVAPFAGAVAWWADKAQFLVTTSAANRGVRAGVFQNAVTKGNYGYIQTAGPATTKFVDAPVNAPNVAGLNVIPSATAGKADCLAAGSAPIYPALGTIALTPTYNAADMTAVVELDIPDTP